MTRLAVRKEFSAHTKARAFDRCRGRCEGCGQKVGVGGNRPEYDHITPCSEGGDNSLENCQVLGSKCCHGPKSVAESRRAAHADKLHRKNIGARKPSRNPLPGSRNSGWKHKLNGTWERRP